MKVGLNDSRCCDSLESFLPALYMNHGYCIASSFLVCCWKCTEEEDCFLIAKLMRSVFIQYLKTVTTASKRSQVSILFLVHSLEKSSTSALIFRLPLHYYSMACCYGPIFCIQVRLVIYYFNIKSL